MWISWPLSIPRSSPSGWLELNDKASEAKIQITNLTRLQEGSQACALFVSGSNVIEFSGDGTYNGGASSFQVCAVDNTDPGRGAAALYLACTGGCSYSSGSAASDNVIDGGNIEIEQQQSTSTGNGGDSPQANTIILDPLLLTEGLMGQAQLFTATVYDRNHRRLANATVTLTRTMPGGLVETSTAITDLDGLAIFSVANLYEVTEYIAISGDTESNAIELDLLLP